MNVVSAFYGFSHFISVLCIIRRQSLNLSQLWVSEAWGAVRIELSAIGYIDTFFIALYTTDFSAIRNCLLWVFDDVIDKLLLLPMRENRVHYQHWVLFYKHWDMSSMFNAAKWVTFYTYALIDNNSAKFILCSTFLSRMWLILICFKWIHKLIWFQASFDVDNHTQL